jgi:hypothetical protein
MYIRFDFGSLTLDVETLDAKLVRRTTYLHFD